jgi:hypothetical protein
MKGGLRFILESIQQMHGAISPFTYVEGSSFLERLENLELQITLFFPPLYLSSLSIIFGFECYEVFL